MIFRIETKLNFSNCQWILIHRLSIVIDAENLENVPQVPQVPEVPEVTEVPEVPDY